MTAKFLYLHIPKTGGVSFRQVFENSVNSNEILHFRNPLEIERHTDESLRMYKFVHGHFNAGYLRHLSSFKTIVSLRSPVSRCLSVYNFWRGLDPADPFWSERNRMNIIRAQAHSLAEMIEHPEAFTRRHFHNLQTRLLAGVTDHDTEINESHLEQAMDSLLKFDFFAINEQLEHDKALMCIKFKLFCPAKPVYLNSTKIKHEVDYDVKLKLLDCNKLDAELLAFAKAQNAKLPELLNN